MAPEQINDLRATKPSADQYSAAATLYNFLTDRFIYDFPKKLHAKIMKILLEDPVPIRDRRPDLPEGLAAIIHRALARDPQARFANVREMRRAPRLREVIAARCREPLPLPHQGPVDASAKRNPTVASRCDGGRLNRFADRSSPCTKPQQPPRSTRPEGEAGPGGSDPGDDA